MDSIGNDNILESFDELRGFIWRYQLAALCEEHGV